MYGSNTPKYMYDIFSRERGNVFVQVFILCSFKHTRPNAVSIFVSLRSWHESGTANRGNIFTYGAVRNVLKHCKLQENDSVLGIVDLI